jgi:hypothetical protein
MPDRAAQQRPLLGCGPLQVPLNSVSQVRQALALPIPSRATIASYHDDDCGPWMAIGDSAVSRPRHGDRLQPGLIGANRSPILGYRVTRICSFNCSAEASRSNRPSRQSTMMWADNDASTSKALMRMLVSTTSRTRYSALGDLSSRKAVTAC